MTPAQVKEASDLLEQLKGAEHALNLLSKAGRWYIEVGGGGWEERVVHLPRQLLIDAYKKMAADCRKALRALAVDVSGELP